MFAFVAWLGFAFGCDPAEPGPPAGPEVARIEQAIIDGSRDTGSQAVVAVFSRDEASSFVSLCTGSVIGPYHVLTAKHCVCDERGRRLPVDTFNIVVGSDLTRVSGVSAVASVSEIRTVPGTDLETDVRNGDDIAILLSSSRLAPTPLRIGTSAPEVGSSATIIGFGRTMPGVPRQSDAGIKFIGTTEVTDFDSHLIQTDGDSATCEGDSGGPLLDDSGDVIGITSFGLDMECFGSTSLYTRVSRHTQLIEDALSWSPSCPDAKPEVCNGVDDNCDGVTDEICKEIGEDCTENGECEGGLCANLDGRTQCTSNCDPTEALPECPSGSYCRSLGCGRGRCVTGAPGTAPPGAECTRDSQCGAGNCGSVEGQSRCGRPCRDGGDPCPMGQLCDTSDGDADCGTCVPVELSRERRPFGSACDTQDQCESRMCSGAGMQGAFCTRSCDASAPCGASTHCRDGVCVAGSLGTAGTSCVNAMDCGTTAPDCVERDGDRVCAAGCSTDSDCNKGFECVAEGDTGRHCVRAGTALGLPCVSDTQCTTGVCEDTVCVRACSPTTPCPEGFRCEAAKDPEHGSFCRAQTAAASEDDGGCSVGEGRGGPGSWIVLSVVFGWLVRRRLRLR